LSEELGRPRIAIATPTRDLTTALFTKCLAEMCLHIGGHFMGQGLADFCIITDTGTLLSDMRNNIVKEALRQDATHILWLDSDMTFPRETLERLMQHGKPIMAASYAQRKRPSKPVAAKNGVWVYTEEDSTGVEQVDYVGAGVMLVEADVYRHLPEPWYMLAWSEEKKQTIGEDVYFCRKARKIGAETWIDHDLTKEITHIGYQAFDWKDALADRDMLLVKQNGDDKQLNTEVKI
jgi:hypothetical protein